MALSVTIFTYFAAKTVLYTVIRIFSATTNFQQKNSVAELTENLSQLEIDILTVAALSEPYVIQM